LRDLATARLLNVLNHQITRSPNHQIVALTRAVPVSITRCELTHIQRTPIDYARAVQEHAAYEEALRRAGCRVQRLPDAPELPDSVFVEDAAVVFDELAVLARPGAASRRPEVDAMAEALRPHRRLARITSPGTLDGGDVLVTPGRIFVGVSGRTNAEGARQLAMHVAPLGLDVIAVPVEGCLHLKSAVTLVSRPPEAGSHATLIVNPNWIDTAWFAGFDLVEVDPDEPAAANVLRIGEHLICAAEHPRTARRLRVRGLATLSVPAAELAKAEGGVTCCSVFVTGS
jgi:dimethylargininase